MAFLAPAFACEWMKTAISEKNVRIKSKFTPVIVTTKSSVATVSVSLIKFFEVGWRKLRVKRTQGVRLAPRDVNARMFMCLCVRPRSHLAARPVYFKTKRSSFVFHYFTTLMRRGCCAAFASYEQMLLFKSYICFLQYRTTRGGGPFQEETTGNTSMIRKLQIQIDKKKSVVTVLSSFT